ncbi:TPA: hypothetical protein DEP34_05180 [Candidatus Uhrbacteria bacterium]|nr:hypothetical protein [Candidatus Uhrbacteria bacterium]HCB19731.1 hypothetical protein [Candidatus Uhrbacteria bacterium]
MTVFFPLLFLGVHVGVAWILVEVFVNIFHGLSRFWYILWHYLVVGGAFFLVFLCYFSLFSFFSIFSTMAIAMVFLFLIEVVVFRYMYSGELWFLNYLDWIIPVFFAASGVYAAGWFVA